MIIKIGNQYFTAENQPIMIILTDQDKQQIKNMKADNRRYAQVDDSYFTPEQFAAWMKEDSNMPRQ